MRNESPVGLATVLGLLPALVAVAVLIVLVIVNGGDVEGATVMLMAIIGAASTVGTAAMRQWRAIAGSRDEFDDSDPDALVHPEPTVPTDYHRP